MHAQLSWPSCSSCRSTAGTRRPAAGLPARENPGAQSRYELIVELARRDKLTVRELIGRLGGGRGHRTFAGTPEQVADEIEPWFTRGRDGFNIMPPAALGLDLFVEHVVPILRARGLFRTEYVPGRPFAVATACPAPPPETRTGA